MRHIVFRGKNKTGEWIYGSLVVNPFDEEDVEIVNGSYRFLPREAVDAETIGQSTGFRLRGGKYVFEGDVVTVEGQGPLAKLVVFDQKAGAFCLANVAEVRNASMRRGCVQHPDTYWWKTNVSKIILEGNIWDDDKYQDLQPFFHSLNNQTL